MADIAFRYDDSELRSWYGFIKNFPEVKMRMIQSLGKRGRTILKDELLSGQALTLHKFPTNVKGRHTISSKVMKKAEMVRVTSTPVNLWEYGQKYKSGRIVPGRYIITKQLKSKMESRLTTIAKDIEDRILEPETSKV